MKGPEAIEMTVAGLTLDQVTRTPIVVLKDSENKLQLPIWIGLLEATAMATELEGIKMARPMTHDLFKNVLGELGGHGDEGGHHGAQGEHLLRGHHAGGGRP